MCYSLTPSLMPRPWFLQGLITGICMAVGYGVGVLIATVFKKFSSFKLQENYLRYARITLGVFWLVLSVVYFYKSQVWQDEVRELVNANEIERTYALRIALLAIVSSLLLLGLGRRTRNLTQRITKLANKRMPHKLSAVVGVVAVVLIYVLIFNVMFYRVFVNISDNLYSNINSTTDIRASRPTNDLRSGGPDSLVKWDSLGLQGRNFVGTGPSVSDIKKFNGETAKQPIRVYVGLKTKPTAKERADLAVKELERTGAFDRKVLVIANPTGSGWLESQGVDTIEYMYGGDSAIASSQYSYFPSWIAFLVEQDKALDSGKELFDAVYDKWSKLPENDRPKLLIYGLSLGSFSGHAAFNSVDDIVSKTDGALFVGTPSDTKLWTQITNDREKGSRQILPIYENGKRVRFASNAKEVTKDQSRWESPRVLYLQHASDGVVWFDFDLLIHRPDWLKEKHGSDVSPRVGWHPIVTFWQVTVDQMLAASVPAGHGHNYGNMMVSSWAAVAQPQGWTEAKTDKLQRIIDGYSIE